MNKVIWSHFVLAGFLGGCGIVKTMNGDDSLGSAPPVAFTNQRMLAGCMELDAYVAKASAYRSARQPHVVADSAPNPSTKAAGANSNGQTYLQESGVDEGDLVKVGGDQIFIKRERDVVVINRSDKSEAGVITVDGDDGKAIRLDEIYLDGSTLVVVASDRAAKIAIFDTHSHDLPKLRRTLSLAGWKQDTRVIGEYLIVSTSSSLEEIQSSQDKRRTTPGYLAPSCDRVLSSQVIDGATGATILNAISLMNDQDVDSIGVTSNNGVLYATTSSIYLASINSRYDAGDMEETFISQIDFDKDKGSFKLRGNGHVKGRIKDKWALKTPDKANGEELLFVSTSSGQLFGEDNSANNHLYTLKNTGSALEQIGEVSDFGKGEDIRAVRYVGTIAYVVTFKKTDPLFAIDLSNPRTPKVIGELEIPGFSTQLHPIGDGTQMIGVGYNADDQGTFAWFQGIQVSLFDVSNPAKLSRMGIQVIGGRGSMSEATYAHHAFFYDDVKGVMAIPFVEVGETSNTGRNIGDYKSSGAMFFKVGSNGFNEMNRVSHEKLMSDQCLKRLANNKNFWWSYTIPSANIRRVFSLDDGVYTVSDYGLAVLDPNDFSTVVKSISFKQQPDCSYYL